MITEREVMDAVETLAHQATSCGWDRHEADECQYGKRDIAEVRKLLRAFVADELEESAARCFEHDDCWSSSSYTSRRIEVLRRDS